MGLFKPAGPVGLELDTGIIRAIEMKGTKRSPVLKAAGQISIPGEAVLEGVVNDTALVAEALRELWEKARFSTRRVVLGISNKGVLMRLAGFPKVPEKKLAQALRFQAAEYFPIPLSQIVMDHSIIGEKNGKNGPEYEILLVAARRDLLDRSLKALAEASLEAVIVDASPLALLRSLPEEQITGSIALVNISNGLSSLLIITGSVPRFARVIPHSLQTPARADLVPEESQEIIDRVASTLQVGNGYPCNEHLTGDPVSAVLEEIQSTINYYLANSEAGINSVILSGSGARIPGVAELLQAYLDSPVKVVHPLDNISGLSNTGNINLNGEGPDFAVSIGLALRGLEG